SASRLSFFSLILLPSPSSTLFPYTTLFRSQRHEDSGPRQCVARKPDVRLGEIFCRQRLARQQRARIQSHRFQWFGGNAPREGGRSEEHTSELHSLTQLLYPPPLSKKKNSHS